MVLLFGLIYSVVFVSSNVDDNKVFAESITSTNSNASLTIAENDLHTTAAPGSIAYTSTDISYSTTNVENYTLKISYAENYNALVGDSADATNISDIANNTLSDNSWGYAWSDSANLSDNDFDGLTYSSVPSYNDGNNLASGNTNVSNSTGKLVFAAKFASNAVTTNYKTSILLSLAVTPKIVTYTLSFDANGGSGAPASQSCTTDSDSCTITISTTMPTRTGYDFLGWSNAKTTDTTTTTASTNYSPGKTNFALSSSSPDTLYAVWRTQVTTSPGFSSISSMQEMTSDICSNAVKGATKTLTDTRTGNYAYTITKLADNKCWMTENLRLGSTTGDLTLSSSDSNVTSNYTLPKAITSGGFDNTRDTNGFYTNQQVYINSYTISSKGAYYSYNAATVNSKSTSSGGSALQDICPKGWRLPTNAEYTILASSLGANNDCAGSKIIRSAPNNFIYTGTIGNNGIIDEYTFGYSWSSTAASAANASSLYFHSSAFYPASNLSRFFGRPVRCIAK